MKLFFKFNISPDRWNTLENKTKVVIQSLSKVVIQSLSNGLSYFIFAFFETCTFGGCNMPPCTGFIVRQCKKKTSLYLQKCPLHCIIKMYRYFTLKIFTKSFARLQCVILHTRHTLLSKNDLHIVTICNDSSKFVNSLCLL